MSGVFAGMLPFVFGLIAALLSVVAVIVLLTADGGRGRAVAFIAVWTAVLFGGALVVALLTGLGYGGAPPAWVGAVQSLAGTLMLVLAVRRLRSSLRSSGDGDPEPPAWVATVNGLTPVKAMGLAAAIAGLVPKNLAMSLGAGTAIGVGGLGAGGSAAFALLFAVLGAVGLLTPLAVALVRAPMATAHWSGPSPGLWPAMTPS
ncbi:GAP family protein [Nocardiopsis sp. CNT312]|uniref:GAP family protein n=1 Tax=Nocardiopsis sp. CNT312 TaxID=1137268 RepID=UPI0004B55455|nr:GAP family protein [Nocardiopsis sp. CNT312]